MFDTIIAYDDYPFNEGKPSPKAMEHLAEKLSVEPKDILYIGDSRVDYECAKNSGSGFIAVSSGKLDKGRWSAVSEDTTVIDSIASLLDGPFFARTPKK